MSNFLITSYGQRYNTCGTQHNIYVRLRFRTTLKMFLRHGGVRVKTHGEHIAIESGEPLTADQRAVIRRELKQDDYYSLVISIGGKYGKKEKFRPIRRV